MSQLQIGSFPINSCQSFGDTSREAVDWLGRHVSRLFSKGLAMGKEIMSRISDVVAGIFNGIGDVLAYFRDAIYNGCSSARVWVANNPDLVKFSLGALCLGMMLAGAVSYLSKNKQPIHPAPDEGDGEAPGVQNQQLENHQVQQQNQEVQVQQVPHEESGNNVPNPSGSAS